MRSLPVSCQVLEETLFFGSCSVGSFHISQGLLGTFIALQEVGNFGAKGTT